VYGKMISIRMALLIIINGILIWVAMDGVCSFIFFFGIFLIYFLNLGNYEKQYYTQNRTQNARCENFPGSQNGRLIIEAHKVRSEILNANKNIIFIRKLMIIIILLQLV
jgi:hypothetical protein